MKINKFRRYALNLSEENRFLIFVITSIFVFLIFLDPLGWKISLLLSWVIGSIFYLVLAFTLILTVDGEFTKRKNLNLKSKLKLLILMVAIMTLLSLLGVGVLLNSLIHHRKDIVDYIFPFSLSILAIILSWLIITTKFAIYYCRLFYDVKDKNGIPYENGIHGGLIFPGTNLPCYLDFFYLAFTVSLGYSVSDVNANKTAMRGIIIVQSFFSFIFFSTVFSIFLNTIISLVPS